MSTVPKPVDQISDVNLVGKAAYKLTAAGLTARLQPNRMDRIWAARLISLALHPFLIAPLSIILILYLDGSEFWAALGWAGLCAAFVVAPALLIIQRKLKQRQYTDADVSVREHRHGLYLFGMACMITCFLMLLWLGAPQPLIACFTAALAAITTLALITRLWTKVSIHTGIMAGVTAMVAFYAIPLALLLGIGTLLVAWSRLVLQRHTLRQVALGGVVGIASICLVFIPIVSL